ncbi:MAG: hypothetical protein J0L56_13845 [Chitinophagales bacterium]|nr:hypothetical protein [Chitinophagales bacterium]
MRIQQVTIRTAFFSLVLIIYSFAGQAQAKDSLELLRQFIAISNGYKQVPLHLVIEMRNSSNFISSAADTAVLDAEFYLQENNSYVRFGKAEQVVNDSLALLVSEELEEIILFKDAGPVVKRMRSMLGLSLPDSSLKQLARRYRSSHKLTGSVSSLSLQSRALLYGTSLPKETIELQYDAVKKIPEQVITTQRSLVRIDSAQYALLKKEAGSAVALPREENLLVLEGNYFLIREQLTTYIYKKIESSFAGDVPVLISDRVMRMADGVYVPVKKYASYRLSMND